jgi:hypothetical protein
MSEGFTDWKEMGILPLQDHEQGVPVGMRQQIVGGRITKMTDPADDNDPEQSLVEYGQEFGLGTLGDVHPWFFWQTVTRGARDTGSWSMAFASRHFVRWSLQAEVPRLAQVLPESPQGDDDGGDAGNGRVGAARGDAARGP